MHSRTGELDRGEGLSAQRSLRAEATSDVIRDDAHIFGRQPVFLRDELCVLVHRLSRKIDSEVFAIELRDRGMGFERRVGLSLRSPNSFN